MERPAVTSSWYPSARLEILRARAALTARCRDYFDQTHCLEMTLPCVQQGPNRDYGIEPMSLAQSDSARWLTTSPEHFLKRLLCAGYGDCYSLGPAFRNDESGQRHNPEFTMLEWYRTHQSLEYITTECCDLFDIICHAALGDEQHEEHNKRSRVYLRYRSIFQDRWNIDPVTASMADLQGILTPDEQAACHHRQDMLDLIMAVYVEPAFNPDVWTVVSHYPADQAAQAAVIPDSDGQLVAARAEIYGGGYELANGYQRMCRS